MESSPSTSAPVYLSGHDLSFYVGEKHILKNITVCFQPNELVAIMGPSGGGKTTLMDVLSGRATSGRTEGKVLFGDKTMDPRELKVVANYVPQDDILYVGLTAREHLMYTARLRLPEAVGPHEKEQRVEQILEALSIAHVADTIVGGVELRGLSGGQKKRVSVGMELVTNPSGLFLDECTTGLDSKTAEDLVRMLANLAHGGRTIMCSIHQPSPQVFGLFDRLVFLSAGSVVYDGPVSNVVAYFAAIGHSTPPDENPADYIMEVVSDGGPQGAEGFNSLWLKKKGQYQAEWTLERERALPEVVAQLRDGEQPLSEPTYPTSFSSQFFTLLERSFWNYARDIWGYPFRILMGLMGGFMIGTMFINMSHDQETVLQKEAAFAMISALAIYDHILGAATVFPGERAVVMREYKNGYYRLFAYYSSRMVMLSVSQLPYLIVMAVQLWGFANLRSGGDRLLFLLSMLHMAAMCSTFVGMCIGVFVADATIANVVIPPIGMFIVMTNGYFILPDNMPFYIDAWTKINFGSYAFENLLLNEFDGLNMEQCVSPDAEHCPFGCDPASCVEGDTRIVGGRGYSGTIALDQLDYNPSDKWGNYAFMVGATFVWFTIAYRLLRYQVDKL